MRDVCPSPDAAADRPEARLAVRLGFLVAGCGVGGLAALMPGLARLLPLETADLGIAALAVLAGAFAGVSGTAAALRRVGHRLPALAGGWGCTVGLPAVALADTPTLLALTLCLFGVFAGALDAAMHANAEALGRPVRRAGQPARHASFVAGAAGGALVTTLLLAVGFEPPLAAALVAAPMALALAVASPYLSEAQAD